MADTRNDTRITVRLPKSERRTAERAAKRAGISLGEYIRRAVAEKNGQVAEREHANRAGDAGAGWHQAMK